MAEQETISKEDVATISAEDLLASKSHTWPSRDEVTKEVLTIERRCRGVLSPKLRKDVNELLAKGMKEEAFILDQNRAACGYDFNQIVLAGPFDGKEHDYTCPVCGASGKYQAPMSSE